MRGRVVNGFLVPETSVVNGLLHAPLFKLSLPSAVTRNQNFPVIFDACVHHPCLHLLTFVLLHKVSDCVATMISSGLGINRRLAAVFESTQGVQQDADWNEFFKPQLRRNRFLVGLEDVGDASMVQFRMVLLYGPSEPNLTGSFLSRYTDNLTMSLQEGRY